MKTVRKGRSGEKFRGGGQVAVEEMAKGEMGKARETGKTERKRGIKKGIKRGISAGGISSGRTGSAVRRRIAKCAAFLLFLVFLLSALKDALYVILILAAAGIHECGHICAAKLFSVPFSRANGGIFALSLKYDFSGSSYLAQTAVSLAGALFNIAASAATMILIKNQTYNTVFFIFSNLSAALFNLMPISPLDGSGALSALLSMVVKEPASAERITEAVSFLFGMAFFVLTVYIQMRVGVSLSLMVISAFLLINCVGKRR